MSGLICCKLGFYPTIHPSSGGGDNRCNPPKVPKFRTIDLVQKDIGTDPKKTIDRID